MEVWGPENLLALEAPCLAGVGTKAGGAGDRDPHRPEQPSWSVPQKQKFIEHPHTFRSNMGSIGGMPFFHVSGTALGCSRDTGFNSVFSFHAVAVETGFVKLYVLLSLFSKQEAPLRSLMV